MSNPSHTPPSRPVSPRVSQCFEFADEPALLTLCGGYISAGRAEDIVASLPHRHGPLLAPITATASSSAGGAATPIALTPDESRLRLDAARHFEAAAASFLAAGAPPILAARALASAGAYARAGPLFEDAQRPDLACECYRLCGAHAREGRFHSSMGNSYEAARAYVIAAAKAMVTASGPGPIVTTSAIKPTHDGEHPRIGPAAASAGDAGAASSPAAAALAEDFAEHDPAFLLSAAAPHVAGALLRKYGLAQSTVADAAAVLKSTSESAPTAGSGTIDAAYAWEGPALQARTVANLFALALTALAAHAATPAPALGAALRPVAEAALVARRTTRAGRVDSAGEARPPPSAPAPSLPGDTFADMTALARCLQAEHWPALAFAALAMDAFPAGARHDHARLLTVTLPGALHAARHGPTTLECPAPLAASLSSLLVAAAAATVAACLELPAGPVCSAVIASPKAPVKTEPGEASLAARVLAALGYTEVAVRLALRAGLTSLAARLALDAGRFDLVLPPPAPPPKASVASTNPMASAPAPACTPAAAHEPDAALTPAPVPVAQVTNSSATAPNEAALAVAVAAGLSSIDRVRAAASASVLVTAAHVAAAGSGVPRPTHLGPIESLTLYGGRCSATLLAAAAAAATAAAPPAPAPDADDSAAAAAASTAALVLLRSATPALFSATPVATPFQTLASPSPAPLTVAALALASAAADVNAPVACAPFAAHLRAALLAHCPPAHPVPALAVPVGLLDPIPFTPATPRPALQATRPLTPVPACVRAAFLPDAASVSPVDADGAICPDACTAHVLVTAANAARFVRDWSGFLAASALMRNLPWKLPAAATPPCSGATGDSTTPDNAPALSLTAKQRKKALRKQRLAVAATAATLSSIPVSPLAVLAGSLGNLLYCGDPCASVSLFGASGDLATPLTLGGALAALAVASQLREHPPWPRDLVRFIRPAVGLVGAPARGIPRRHVATVPLLRGLAAITALGVLGWLPVVPATSTAAAAAPPESTCRCAACEACAQPLPCPPCAWRCSISLHSDTEGLAPVGDIVARCLMEVAVGAIKRTAWLEGTGRRRGARGSYDGSEGGDDEDLHRWLRVTGRGCAQPSLDGSEEVSDHASLSDADTDADSDAPSACVCATNNSSDDGARREISSEAPSGNSDGNDYSDSSDGRATSPPHDTLDRYADLEVPTQRRSHYAARTDYSRNRRLHDAPELLPGSFRQSAHPSAPQTPPPAPLASPSPHPAGNLATPMAGAAAAVAPSLPLANAVRFGAWLPALLHAPLLCRAACLCGAARSPGIGELFRPFTPWVSSCVPVEIFTQWCRSFDPAATGVASAPTSTPIPASASASMSAGAFHLAARFADACGPIAEALLHWLHADSVPPGTFAVPRAKSDATPSADVKRMDGPASSQAAPDRLAELAQIFGRPEIAFLGAREAVAPLLAAVMLTHGAARPPPTRVPELDATAALGALVAGLAGLAFAYACLDGRARQLALAPMQVPPPPPPDRPPSHAVAALSWAARLAAVTSVLDALVILTSAFATLGTLMDEPDIAKIRALIRPAAAQARLALGTLLGFLTRSLVAPLAAAGTPSPAASVAGRLWRLAAVSAAFAERLAALVSNGTAKPDTLVGPAALTVAELAGKHRRITDPTSLEAELRGLLSPAVLLPEARPLSFEHAFLDGAGGELLRHFICSGDASTARSPASDSASTPSITLSSALLLSAHADLPPALVAAGGHTLLCAIANAGRGAVEDEVGGAWADLRALHRRWQEQRQAALREDTRADEVVAAEERARVQRAQLLQLEIKRLRNLKKQRFLMEKALKNKMLGRS